MVDTLESKRRFWNASGFRPRWACQSELAAAPSNRWKVSSERLAVPATHPPITWCPSQPQPVRCGCVCRWPRVPRRTSRTRANLRVRWLARHWLVSTTVCAFTLAFSEGKRNDHTAVIQSRRVDRVPSACRVAGDSFRPAEVSRLAVHQSTWATPTKEADLAEVQHRGVAEIGFVDAGWLATSILSIQATGPRFKEC
jgi:hypothetical protein